MIAAIVTGRRLAFLLAACASAGIFLAFVALERPGLGMGHFFYLPVCLVALVTDEIGGACAGVLAAAIYSAAVVVAPHVPTAQALTTATGIRLITFAAVGALVGGYARRHRQLVTQLHGHARTDFVTGVANVRAFDEEVARRCDSDVPFSLVLVDVNELRRVNEVHGHIAGDVALKRVATTLTAIASHCDFVARVGGDEFVLLTGLTKKDVPALAARLNAALADADLSVTLAATAAPADGRGLDELYRKAGDRLFTAKLLRANRTALAAV